jgi:hypothetical protein
LEIFVYSFGFFFAIIIPFYPISKVVDLLWVKITNLDFKSKYCDYSPQYGSKNPINLAGITGCLERTLYIKSLLLGKPEFIGVWLALKVAGQWDLWKGETEYNGVKITGCIRRLNFDPPI